MQYLILFLSFYWIFKFTYCTEKKETPDPCKTEKAAVEKCSKYWCYSQRMDLDKCEVKWCVPSYESCWMHKCSYEEAKVETCEEEYCQSKTNEVYWCKKENLNKKN